MEVLRRQQQHQQQRRHFVKLCQIWSFIVRKSVVISLLVNSPKTPYLRKRFNSISLKYLEILTRTAKRNIKTVKLPYIVSCRGASQLGGPCQGGPPRV